MWAAAFLEYLSTRLNRGAGVTEITVDISTTAMITPMARMKNKIYIFDMS